MEIFDVTETDPSLLVNDDLGVNYTDENLITSSSQATSNPPLRHSSGPASLNRQRHSSDSAFTSRTRKTSIETPNFRGLLSKYRHTLHILFQLVILTVMIWIWMQRTILIQRQIG